MTDLYDYNAKELLGQPLTILVPSISIHDWQEEISRLRFFGSVTKRQAQFPIIVRKQENTVRITSMPVIAGLMTINGDGIIEGCNDIFVKYLFGFSQQDLLHKNISQILPQFPNLLENLKRDDLLQPGLIINNIICRKLLIEDSVMLVNHNKRLLTHTPNNQPLPVLFAIHRDGTPLEVQLQLKLVETDDQEEFALWISFDREVVFKRYGHHHLISTPLIYSPSHPTHEVQYRSPKVTSTTRDLSHKKCVLMNPPIDQKEEINYSAQTKSTTIDDYIILDSLGQGAYGLVKLATKKNDPSQVISYYSLSVLYILFIYKN